MSLKQIDLFEDQLAHRQLSSHVQRDGNRLLIPEGLHTVPCTHGIHRFAGKFIPQIPRYLIRSFLSRGEGDIILDPFCGSGTTLVEAALEGKQFVGMDIDPLAVAISKAKTSVLSENDLEYIEKYWSNHDYKQNCVHLYPRVPNLLHWFSQTALVELSSIKSACLDMPEHLRLFNLVIFSSIIRRVSNADDQTQKTYVSGTLPKSPPRPSELHPIFLERAVKGMREYRGLLPTKPKGNVIKGDAGKDLGNVEFRHVLTSPPYIDSIDYVYNNMLEYFWMLDELGIHSYERYRKLRKKPMGFRIDEFSKPNDFVNRYLLENYSKFEFICSRIADISPREALAVRSFFSDYCRHVSSISGKQGKGSFYICIIGNSYIRGTTVPTVDFIVDIHRSMGYNLIDKVGYEIKRHYMKFPRRNNSKKIVDDHILVFTVT
jgi:SAM-dependent methyltransferase